MIKHLGILGLGSRSTLFYIKEIYGRKYDECSDLPFKLLNTNFDKINNLLPTPSKELEHILKGYIEKLIELDIDAILVPNITLHETIDRLNIQTTIIHPIHLTIKEIQKKKYKKVFLFGSTYTMKSDYIKSSFAENGIEISLPSKQDMEFADEIRKRVYQETETKELLDNFNLIIKKYAKNNAVVIACTELSIILENDNLKIIDMTRVQINHTLSLFK